ncbi:hypothetical protein CAPN001_14640 [Capnocytophaga stomatis]|uniref:DUF3078 domain-containing protein n=1 Tax=Capnocytophaga stomatis TaxID=1848904 RepID=UPI00195189AB|nr:DUF3078 domain-containing protein [Capnocytophaga stomatis]GIJ96895.1 hypothetical protein CAPN001_14640 [Capnocytophaga stomatis]
MKKITLLLLITISSSIATISAQIRRAKGVELPAKVDTIQVQEDEEALKLVFTRFNKAQEKWFKFNQVNLNLSEVAFSNWSAGGENSISTLLNAKFRRRYSERTYFWDNELEINYGVNAQKGREPRKTDDKLSLISALGYRGNAQSFWYYTARFQFLTQFSNGYSYPNTEKAISKFLAPAYVYLGLGIEYAPNNKNKFNLFLSPLTMKTTLVLDKDLADQGVFGVEGAIYAPDGRKIKSGKKSNTELGFSVSGRWNEKIADNIRLENVFNFYGDYLKDFGNIDLDWEANLNFKVNSYVQARIGLHIKYDDDVKFYSYKDASGKTHKYGARTQLKQILGIGLSYTF